MAEQIVCFNIAGSFGAHQTVHGGFGLGHATIAFCVGFFLSRRNQRTKAVRLCALLLVMFLVSIVLAFWNAAPSHAEHYAVDYYLKTTTYVYMCTCEIVDEHIFIR